MKQTTIPVKPDSKVNVIASEDLSIEGTQDKFLTAVVRHGETLKIIDINGNMEIKATTDCRLLVPDNLLITIEKVGNDASVKGVTTHLIIGKIGGDLALQSFPGASIETVGGDLTFRDSTGAVEIARVGGDLHGEGVAALTSAGIGGDATLLDINGKINVRAGGDIELSSTLIELPELSARAGGGINMAVVPGAKAHLEMHSDGEEISVHACGQDADWEGAELSLLLGEGGSLILLEAGGEIEVSDHANTSRDFEEVFDDLEDNWKDFGIELEERIRESLGLASETLARASHNAVHASDRAREKMDKVMRKIEERTSNLDQKKRFVGFAIDNPSSPTKPKIGASDEERMLVLRMLQEKKISVEEAEKLLNALDR